MVNIHLSKPLRQSWADSRPLTFTCMLMLGAFAASLLATLVDHRIITGVNAWIKPAKFALSSAIFAGTIAFLLRFISHPRKPWAQFFGWALAIALMVEVAIIDLQAFRGTTSHFNNTTVLDTALFIVMFVFIAILWFASMGVTVLLFRERFADPALGWALRLGMVITVIGSGAGGMMVRPSHVRPSAGAHSALAGSHTVGAPDGGPGAPGIGWSTTHGDLRISHFFGLHGVQAIPLFLFLMRRRRQALDSRHQVKLVMAAAAVYLGGVSLLAWQALQGRSIFHPDAALASAYVSMFATLLWMGWTGASLTIPSGRTGGLHTSA